ncbi:MAG: hypothetical protein GX375_04750 [Clostridiales bacterium]|nr:hypothetical protein [Clostridiales bacterium]
MKKTGLYFILIAILSILITTSPALAQSNNMDDKGKVILLVIDRVSWNEIDEAHTPNLDKLIDMGAIGLMTTNTGSSLSQNNAYLTIGAGARAVGVSGSQEALSYSHKYRGDRIENVMYQITGFRMAEGAVGNPSIAKLHRENEKKAYNVGIGSLGTALREAGLKAAVLGNCDNYRRLEKEGGGKNFLVSMMMDDRGIIPLGDISQSLIIDDPNWPMGIRTDYDKMLEAFKEMTEQAHVIAVQLGDTSRAEDFRHQCMDSRIELHKRRALEEGDRFLGKVMDYFDPHCDYMMVLTPVGASKEIGNNNRLTPIVIAGKGINKGWLTSGSTHREGVVTNLDIGTSILNFFGLSPLLGQGGAPIYSTNKVKETSAIVEFNAKLTTIYNQRPFLLRAYVYILIPILALAALCLLSKREYLRVIKPMLIFIMVVPLVYLFLPLLQQAQLHKTAIIAMSMCILVTALVCRIFRSTIDKIMAISSLTAMALILDQWMGMRLIQSSPLGYDVIAAARFYGMGNEYMGVLVSSICCTGTALIERFRGQDRLAKIAALFVGLIAIYTMASPALSANVGGTIAIFIAISISILMVKDKKIRIPNLVAMGVMMMLILAGTFFLDSLRVVDSQSHMGQTVNAIKQNGLLELFYIFYRKIYMNIQLIRSTIWTRVFLTSLGVVVLLLFRPVGIFRDVYRKHELLIKGLTGASIGAIAALVFNDSGIVAAATAMVFIAPPFIMLIVDEIEEKVMDGALEDEIQFETPSS